MKTLKNEKGELRDLKNNIMYNFMLFMYISQLAIDGVS